MPPKDGSLDALLQKSWGSLRTRLPVDPALFLDPRVALEKIVVRNGKALIRELQESGEALVLLFRLARGGSLNDEEVARLKSQLADMAKSIPALAIFALPGGAILLPVLAKCLPWDLLPSAFLRSSQDAAAQDAAAQDAAGDDNTGKSEKDFP